MADNRLYIVDTATGEALFVAKSMSKHGWEWMQTDEQMDRWLESRDMSAFGVAAAYIAQLPPTKLYLGTDGLSYPQYTTRRVYTWTNERNPDPDDDLHEHM